MICYRTVKAGPVKQNSDDNPILIDDDEEEEPKSTSQSSTTKTVESIGDSDSLPDLDADPVVEEPNKQKSTSRNTSQERLKPS